MWPRIRNKLSERKDFWDEDKLGRVALHFDGQAIDSHYRHHDKTIIIRTKDNPNHQLVRAAFHELIHREQYYRQETPNHEPELDIFLKNLTPNPCDEKYASNPLEWMAYAGGDVEAAFQGGDTKQSLMSKAAQPATKRFERLDSFTNAGFCSFPRCGSLGDFSGYWKYYDAYVRALPE